MKFDIRHISENVKGFHLEIDMLFKNSFWRHYNSSTKVFEMSWHDHVIFKELKIKISNCLKFKTNTYSKYTYVTPNI